MPKEITAIKPNAVVVYRFIGKLIYIKGNNNQYSTQLANQLKDKGAKITFGRGWVKCDLFAEKKLFFLNNYTIDLDSNTIINKETKQIDIANDENVEKVLASFFESILIKAEFKCTMKDI